MTSAVGRRLRARDQNGIQDLYDDADRLRYNRRCGGLPVVARAELFVAAGGDEELVGSVGAGDEDGVALADVEKLDGEAGGGGERGREQNGREEGDGAEEGGRREAHGVVGWREDKHDSRVATILRLPGFL